MCPILKILRSSCYAWLNRNVSLREKRREELKVEIKRVFELSKKRYVTVALGLLLN